MSAVRTRHVTLLGVGIVIIGLAICSTNVSVTASPSTAQGMVVGIPRVGAAAPVTATSATASTRVRDRTLVAPYVDMGLYPTANLVRMASSAGVSAVTAAFIVAEAGSPCSPAWGGYSDYAVGGPGDFSRIISRFQAAGGRVIVSFGGASGTELADGCTSDAALLSAYTAVVDRYGIDRIDFDIEGASVANASANQRRARVVKRLQHDYAAKGKPVEVSLTVPVMPDGLDVNGLRAVREFVGAGVDVATVNIMAMDYGPSYTEMGRHAITAARRTATQLRSIPAYRSLTRAQALAKVGLTPMIGQNDVPTEVFSLADAAKVAAFVKAKGVGMLAWWELTRDKPCSTPNQGLYLCTQVSAPQWAFSRAFVRGLS